MATSNANVCEICKFSDTNDLDLGEWKTSEGCTIHHFCALLSTNSVQNGTDSQGIDGFLVKDIRDLVKLHTKSKCHYCKNKSASVRCSVKKCARIFHVKCGVERNCLFIFEDKFLAHCHLHTKITEKFAIHDDLSACGICKDTMGPYNSITSIPSCCDQGYFHKKCIQRHARSAGYLTKCPSCGYADDIDGHNYRKFLANRGIFCPDKDADWELSPNAYDSLLRNNNRCDATNCRCPDGPEHNSEDDEWNLLKCTYCGHNAIHVGCHQSDTTTYSCKHCNEKTTLLITVFTENSTNNEENANDDDYENPSTARANINNNNHKKKRAPENVEVENKVFKLCDTDRLKHRSRSLILIDQNANVDPLCDAERKKMRNDRLDMFFGRADFDAKPPPPPWLI